MVTFNIYNKEDELSLGNLIYDEMIEHYTGVYKEKRFTIFPIIISSDGFRWDVSNGQLDRLKEKYGHLSREEQVDLQEVGEESISDRGVYYLIDKAQRLIDKKAHDYSADHDYHSNFKYAGAVAEPFDEVYKPYAMLIGVKLARLSQLLSQSKEPMNESIEDSFVDLINYCALMGERYLQGREVRG